MPGQRPDPNALSLRRAARRATAMVVTTVLLATLGPPGVAAAEPQTVLPGQTPRIWWMRCIRPSVITMRAPCMQKARF